MNAEALKKYIGTKEVMAAPMEKQPQWLKVLLARTRITMNGDQASMFSTTIRMAVPTIPGHMLMSSTSLTRLQTISMTVSTLSSTM